MKALKFLIPIVVILIGIAVACGTGWQKGDKGDPGSPGPAGTPGSPGDPGEQGKNGTNAVPCTLDPVAGTVECNGVVYKIPSGKDGADGQAGQKGDKGDPGNPGADGRSVVFSLVSATADQCPAGGNVLLIAYDMDGDGLLTLADQDIRSANLCNGSKGDQGDKGDTGDKGDQGIAGPAGPIGPQGQPGTPGKDGQDAPVQQFKPATIITPCGEDDHDAKPALLCLGDGTLLGIVSSNGSAKTTKLAVILPGTYASSEDKKCVYTVSLVGSVKVVVWPLSDDWLNGTALCGE